MNTELDEFLNWCEKCGHYTVAPLAENFRKYKASLKESEHQALQERTKAY